MKLKRKILFSGVCLVLVVFSLFYFLSKKKDIEKDFIYLESPKVDTCTNNSTLFYELRIIALSKPSVLLRSSNDKVKVNNTNIRFGEKISQNLNIYYLEIELTVPQNKVNYALDMEINDLKFALDNLSNYNYESKEDEISQFTFYSGFEMSGKQQAVTNEMKFGDRNVEGIVVATENSSEIKSNILDVHTLQVETKTKKPRILGYSYTFNEKKACAGNMYQTELLDEDRVERIIDSEK